MLRAINQRTGVPHGEFIYTTYKARKAHGDKVILDDVTLSFYPGAKIGVVGPNGMGKSTLLKIMAGLEVSQRRGTPAPGYSVGILQQEPPLDEDKTVLEKRCKMAFGDVLAKIDRFNAISAEMADPDADFDAPPWKKWASCRKPSTPPTAGTLTASCPRPWTPCSAPTPTCR